MKFTELDPHFLERTSNGYQQDSTIKDGVVFLCPRCFVANGNSNVGTHVIICWFCNADRPVPDTETPGPGRWLRVGDEIAMLSLGACPGKTHSVLLNGDCQAHFVVVNGEVTTC